MKFPKSVHAEGWGDHIDTTTSPTAPAVKTNAHPLNKPGMRRVGGGAKISATTPYAAMTADGPSASSVPRPHTTVNPATPVYNEPRSSNSLGAGGAGAASVSRPPQRSAAPWLIGAGVGIGVIALAVTMSRNMSPSEPEAPIVVGQASTSPEDALLQSNPPAAGALTEAPETTQTPAEPTLSEPAPAVTPTPAAPAVEPAKVEPPKVESPRETPRVLAAAEPKPEPKPKAAAEPAPVTKTLQAKPDVLAQAEPRREAALVPLAPVTPTVTPTPVEPATATAAPTPMAAAPTASAPAEVIPPVATVTPETAAPITPPVTPPIAQAQPPVQPQAPAVNPEDTGITMNVRQALAADTALAAVPIAVTTDHGVVKLEGQAPDVQARERATVVAAATTGVKAVDNRLTVPPVATLGQVSASGG